MEVFQAVVPPGAGPGAIIPVWTPSGRQVQVQVPPDVYENMAFTAQVPYGPPNGGMPPQQMMMGGGGGPLAHLQTLQRVEVQEEVNMVQAITALIGVEINLANKYKVVDPNNQEVFYAVEQTDCCRQNMKRGACADCVGWDADLLYTYGGQANKFLKLHRDNTCTCCCFNRPIMDIIDESNGNKVGSIQDPFACCDLTFKMRDENDNEVIWVKGGCCQWGLCCPLPCGPCSKVEFDIQDAKSGNSIGQITKVVPSCCKFLFTPETTNYEIEFQDIQHPMWKAMIIALSVFIDFRYFNKVQDPEDVGNTGLIGMINNS